MGSVPIYSDSLFWFAQEGQTFFTAGSKPSSLHVGGVTQRKRSRPIPIVMTPHVRPVSTDGPASSGLSSPSQIFSLWVSEIGPRCLSPPDLNRQDCPSEGTGVQSRMVGQAGKDRLERKLQMRQKAHAKHTPGNFYFRTLRLEPTFSNFFLRVCKSGLICLSPQNRNGLDCPSAEQGARAQMPAHSVIERIKERIRVKRNAHPNVGHLAIASIVLDPKALGARSSLPREKKRFGSHSRKPSPSYRADANAHRNISA